MDTPGVDSTDDAHRLSTESSLHVADLVFYVMDYNHVQSGLNFTFTKNLMAYAVGRAMTTEDACVLQEIGNLAVQKDKTFVDLVVAISKSDQFRYNHLQD